MPSKNPRFSSPVTVLLADANPSYREITRKMLKFYDANFLVDDCPSIADCLKMAKSHAYDLIISEEILEDGDSFDLLQALKRERLDTPVMVLFAEGHEDRALAAIEAGAIDYITKARGYLTALPFTVKKILEKRRTQQTRQRRASVGPPESTLTQKGYFILNHQGKFLSANPGMESLTGYSEDELLELTLLDLLPKGQEWRLFEWLQNVESGESQAPFETYLIGKYGAHIPVFIRLRVRRDDAQNIKSYRGEIEEIAKTEKERAGGQLENGEFQVIDPLWELINSSRDEPLPRVLGKLAKLSCRIFKFNRATVALLDRSKKAFIKVAVVGYALPAESEKRWLEVPKDVIDRIFAHRYRIKVLYYNQEKQNATSAPDTLMPERRSQKRRPPGEWHPRDLIVMNLAHRDLETFGYISLDDPAEPFVPTRRFFKSLELFSTLASMIVENHSYLMEQAQRSRRLTQALVTSNIFKLYFKMDELLREAVWSVKFSLGYNLVMLGLNSQKTHRLEIRSVACEDKIKAAQIRDLSFALDDFLSLLQPQFRLGKCYFIRENIPVLAPVKEIYTSGFKDVRLQDEWPLEAMLIAPLKSRTGKIMGALFVDDPEDLKKPDADQLKTLQILANQISVAIENRLLYVEAKKKAAETSPAASSGLHGRMDYPKGANGDASTRQRPFWARLFGL